jgi:hypothetical protein
MDAEEVRRKELDCWDCFSTSLGGVVNITAEDSFGNSGWKSGLLSMVSEGIETVVITSPLECRSSFRFFF